MHSCFFRSEDAPWSTPAICLAWWLDGSLYVHTSTKLDVSPLAGAQLFLSFRRCAVEYFCQLFGLMVGWFAVCSYQHQVGCVTFSWCTVVSFVQKMRRGVLLPAVWPDGWMVRCMFIPAPSWMCHLYLVHSCFFRAEDAPWSTPASCLAWWLDGSLYVHTSTKLDVSPLAGAHLFLSFRRCAVEYSCQLFGLMVGWFAVCSYQHQVGCVTFSWCTVVSFVQKITLVCQGSSSPAYPEQWLTIDHHLIRFDGRETSCEVTHILWVFG